MIIVNPRTKKTKFEIRAPKAKVVSLLGDFNGWNEDTHGLKRGKNGSWSLELKIPAGEHQFLYRIDRSEWAHDDAAPRVINAFGTENSLAVVTFPSAARSKPARSKAKKG